MKRCCCSVAQSCPTLWNPMDCRTPGLPVPHHLPKFAQVHVHCIGDTIQPSDPLMPSSLILWCPLLVLPSIFPSIRDFSNESSVHIRWPKYWSFIFSISPSSECSGLISLKIDWFDLLAVQRTFSSLLQHHSSKASILWHSAFFMVHLSQQYVTTGKTIALDIWTFVGRVISLLFNTLSRFVIAFHMQSTSCEMLGWINSQAGIKISRLLLIISDMQMIPL